MLDLGLATALEWHGLSPRVVGYCERESGAANILLARMEEESLECAPVRAGNLEDLRPEPFRGLVDWVVGGIPCQPFSSAGKQRGLADERWLWPKFWEFTASVGAKFIALENVRGFEKKGLAAVRADLDGAGWRYRWCHLKAADVGASHRRERFFLMAHAGGVGREWFAGDGREAERRVEHAERGLGNAAGAENRLGKSAELAETAGRGEAAITAAGDAGGGMGDTVSGGGGAFRQDEAEGEATAAFVRPSQHLADAEKQRQGKYLDCPLPVTRDDARQAAGGGGGELADTENLRPPAAWLSVEHAAQRPGPRRRGDAVADTGDFRQLQRTQGGHGAGHWSGDGELPFFAPPPNAAAWAGVLRQDGGRAPALEPGVCVLVDGLAVVLDASRTDQLRAAGNGVVALQAAVAYGILFERLFREGDA